MEGYLWEFTYDDDSEFLVVTETFSIDEAIEKYRKYKGFVPTIICIKYISPVEVR